MNMGSSHLSLDIELVLSKYGDIYLLRNSVKVPLEEEGARFGNQPQVGD